MYRHKLIKAKTPYLFLISAFAWLSFLAPNAFALSTDKDQDIEIEADTAELDDSTGITVYLGNVIVTQGTLKMTGDKMTIYHDENDEVELVVMVGRPATYRQLPDDATIYDEAESLRMEYYEQKQFAILIEQAEVRKPDSTMRGKRIEYDTEKNIVKATGGIQTIVAEDGTEKKQGGRVKLTIKKKKKDQE